MRRNHITRALALFIAVVVGSAGIAHADNVRNDVVAGGNDTITAGQNTVVSYYIQATGNDDQTGCNAADGTPATVTIDLPTGVTANPGSLTFNSCGVNTKRGVTFSSNTPGHYSIKVSVTDAAVGGGTYTTNLATFTLKVNAAPAPVNTAPSVPGAPAISEGVSPNTGTFSLSWAASTDAEGNSIAYTLERRNGSAGAVFTAVASGITNNSYVFSPSNAESEGTWVYRVKASDGSLSSDYSGNSASVVVDRSAPNAPVAAATTPPDFTAAGGNKWWRGLVTVEFAPAGDPDLADGSAGSGVNPASVPGPTEFSTSGTYTATGKVSDKAGNESAVGTLAVGVDATNPTAVFIDCPTTPVLFGSGHTVNWSASDVHSGLSGDSTGSVSLDTTSVGSNKTVAAPAPVDNVRNTGTAPSCSYSVEYSSTGVLQPINPNGSSIFKIKSTVPVKIQLTGDSAGITNGNFTISLAKVTGALVGGDDESVISTSAHSGNTMRYDSSADQYIFNLGTSKLSTGTYKVFVTLDDGTKREATFGLRS